MSSNNILDSNVGSDIRLLLNGEDNKRMGKENNEESDVNTSIGRKIRNIRQSFGFTQSMLSDIMGVSFQQVQKYEKGSNRISATALWKLSSQLGISIASFFPSQDQLHYNGKVQVHEKGKNFKFNFTKNKAIPRSPSREIMNLVNDFNKLEDVKLRKKVASLVSSVVKASQSTGTRS